VALAEEIGFADGLVERGVSRAEAGRVTQRATRKLAKTRKRWRIGPSQEEV
jgi:hypothetical protein